MKSNKKYRFKWRFLVFFCVFGYVALSFGQQFYRIYDMDQELDTYLKTKTALLQEQRKLQEEVELLQDNSYIERIAREDLGLIKPGETLLVPGAEGDIRKAKSVDAVSDNIH